MARIPQVLIVGAGYAGLNAALYLNDRRKASESTFDLTVLDQHPYHLVKIRLHEAAPRDADVSVPLGGLLRDEGITVRQGVVTAIDLSQRHVQTNAGPISYDYLLLALGSVTNFFNIPGMAEHGFSLDSLADAVRLRGHIQNQVVLAADTADAAERDRRLRFVIGGAGYTGIELAGELADDVPKLCERVGLERDAARIEVVDAHPRILPVLDDDSARYAADVLGKKGIQLRTGVKVTACTEDDVTLDPGGLVPTMTMIWAGGIRANPLVSAVGSETGQQGRLVVDETLRVSGRPEVFAVGDCALALDPATKQAIPATAQLALQEGRHAAENMLSALAGRDLTPFDPSSRGEIVSLGHDRAIGWTRTLMDRHLKLRGLIGGLAKRVAEEEWEIHLWRETHHLDGIFQ